LISAQSLNGKRTAEAIMTRDVQSRYNTALSDGESSAFQRLTWRHSAFTVRVTFSK
jgi:hypothetical protein